MLMGFLDSFVSSAAWTITIVVILIVLLIGYMSGGNPGVAFGMLYMFGVLVSMGVFSVVGMI